MKIYCSGIGGIGLSAYASLQNAEGNEVLGSDRTETDLTRELEKSGIKVFYDQDGSHVPKDCDLFVYSEAIPVDAPERMNAQEYGIAQKTYFEALGEYSKDKFVVAVCGTHGKSSTTAMAAKVLVDTGKDPTIVVGTTLPDLDGKNWRKGSGDIFLMEACEYRRSFLHLSPNIILMTNADGDHLDAFKGVEDYQDAFVEFLNLLPDDGVVITHASIPECKEIASRSGKKTIDSDKLPLVDLKVPGTHMQQNAQLVLALADQLKIDEVGAQLALKNYRGCWRRMELKGSFRDIPVIDDYGHHPIEIKATLNAIKEKFPDKRLICVYQPHMHDRTLRFYDDFIISFSDADLVIVPDIYDARSDVETDMVDIDKFVADIQKGSETETINGQSLDATEALLRDEILQSGDLLVVMGAGDVTDLASKMTV